MKQFLESVPFFSRFTKEQLNIFMSILKEKSYLKDNPIFMQDDLCDRAFILKEGKVKASKFSIEGKELIIKFFKPGDFFGEAPLFIEEGRYPASAYACEKSEVYCFTREDFRNLILQNPEIALAIIEVYSKKIMSLVELVEELSLKSTRTRLLRFLMECIPKNQRSINSVIDVQLPITQSDIASKIGTVREQVSRIFTKLNQEGMLEVHGKNVTIYDLEKIRTEVCMQCMRKA